jgi:hypothetical protein
MSGMRAAAASMRAGVFLTLALIVFISLAAGFTLGAWLAAPRYTANDIRSLLAAELLPEGTIYAVPQGGQAFDQNAAFEDFAGRLLGHDIIQGVGVFERGKLVYGRGLDSEYLPDAVREGVVSHFMWNRLILEESTLNDGKAYYAHPVHSVYQQRDERVVLLELASLDKPLGLSITQFLDSLVFLPFSSFVLLIFSFAALILLIAFALTWRYLARPLSQTLSMLEALDSPGSCVPKGKIACLLAPAISSCVGRMHTRDENAAKDTLAQVLTRRKGYDFDSFTAATVYAGTALHNGHADVSLCADGRYAFTLLALPEISEQNSASLARVALAGAACTALSATSAETASSMNKCMRHASRAAGAGAFTAQAAFAFFDPKKKVVDFCLLGKAQLIRYDQRSQRLQGYFQSQATLGRLDPADFDGRLGYSQIEVGKGETLFFVSGDIDWEDVIRDVLKKAETDAEKQQILLALLKQRIDASNNENSSAPQDASADESRRDPSPRGAERSAAVLMVCFG